MSSRIIGDRQVVQALNELSRGVPLALVDTAARGSLKPMQEDAKKRARMHRNYIGKYSSFFPQPKGGRQKVDQGITTGRSKRSTRTRRKFFLGAAGRARKILHLLEFGTRPHFQPKFRGGFMHPGARPKPVMTPAYEAHKTGVERAFGVEIWRLLEKKILTLYRVSKTGRPRR